MSKKKFISGLESLFGEAFEETAKGILFPAETEVSKKSGESDKRSTGKDFSSELQSFLDEAFEQSIEDLAGGEKEAPQSSLKSGKQARQSLSGLDLLISSAATVPPVPKKNIHTKRVTLLIDKAKFTRLKEIARKEKSYLKTIVNNIVKDFIDNYEKSHRD